MYAGDLRRQRCCRQVEEQPPDAGLVLAAALRLRLAQIVDAAAGVRVEEQEWGGLLLQVLDEHHEHDVLEHVREVAGVEGVAVVHG